VNLLRACRSTACNMDPDAPVSVAGCQAGEDREGRVSLGLYHKDELDIAICDMVRSGEDHSGWPGCVLRLCLTYHTTWTPECSNWRHCVCGIP
jgi:hypothetical protein